MTINLKKLRQLATSISRMSEEERNHKDELKQLLISVRNGALITPVLYRMMELIHEARKDSQK